MKKIFVLLTLVIAATLASAQYNLTPNIGLEIPSNGSTNWNVPLNFNFNLLDQILGGQLQPSGFGLQLLPIFGSGSPTSVPCGSNQGQNYYNTAASFTLYVCNAGGWQIVSGSGGGGATLPANAVVYGLTSTTSRAAVASDVATLLSSLSGCGTSNYTYSPASGICIPGITLPVTSATGGTGQNFSSSSGVPQILSGVWGVSTTLANGTKATTQTVGDNSNALATDAFVLANAGIGSVTHSLGNLTAHKLVVGNGGGDVTVDPDASTDGSGNVSAVSVIAGTYNGSCTTCGPATLQMPYNTGTIPSLVAGSAGWAGPSASGGTPWLGFLNGATSAGLAHAGAPTTIAGVNGSQITWSGVAINDLTATGTPSSSTYLRGDNTWSAVSCPNCLVTLNPGSNPSGTLQAAITTAAAGSTIILPSSYAETPTAGISISKAITLECQPGATITRGANGTLVSITASNVVIEDCKFNGGGFTGDTILATSVSGIQILGDTILNGTGVGVYFSSVTGSRIQNNSVQSNNADDIVVFDASNNDVISGNVIDNSQDLVFSKAISLHSNSVPSVISNITVSNNTIKNRFGFAIEVGPFNGYMPTSITISGNVTTQLSSTNAGSGTSGNFGGYSIFADTSTTIGNTYTNESGQMAGLPGLEIFGQTHNASNNSITGAVATVYTTSSSFTNNNIMQGNLTAVNGNNTGNPVIQQLSISGNVINTSGVVPGNAWTANTPLEQNYIFKDTNGCLEKSIYRVSATSNLTGATQPTWPACTQAAAGTITHDNNIDWMDLGPPMLPQLAAGAAYPGIELLCNTSGLTCGDYLVENNKIIDNFVSTDQGFQDFAISGTTQKSTVFTNNQFIGWNTCYSIGSGLSPSLGMNDEAGCTTLGGVAAATHASLATVLAGGGGTTYTNVVASSTADTTVAAINAKCTGGQTYWASVALSIGTGGTIASGCNVMFVKGGVWTIASGQTVTFANPVMENDGPSQHFAGSGLVSLPAANSLVPVEWFGAVGYSTVAAAAAGTDSTAAIQADLNSLTAGSAYLQSQAYRITSALSISTSLIGIVGAKYGGSAPDNNYTISIDTPHSRLVSTSASADFIDAGGNSTTLITANEFRNFSMDRTQVPTGSAAGLKLTFAGGAVVDHVVSNDSVYGFYCQVCASLGTGLFTNDVAQYGYGSVSETSGTYYGFYLVSPTQNGEDSLRILNSGSSTKASIAGITTYGMILTGEALNDVMSYGFETENQTYGQAVMYTSGGTTNAASDLHFTNSIHDGCRTSCFYINGASNSIGSSITILGGWVAPSTISGTVTYGIDIESSSGVTVQSVQVEQPANQEFTAGIAAVNSSGIVLNGNNFLNASSISSILLSSTNNSTITGNRFWYESSGATNFISLTGTSSYNTIAENAFSGTATNGISLGGSTANNVYQNRMSIDPTGISNLISDSGSNSEQTSTIAKGSLALATSNISSNTCQGVTAGSVNSAAAANVATTDRIVWSPAVSLQTVTGYQVSTSGALSIDVYPTAGYVNFNVCNWTTVTITPGALTLNWSVVR